MNLRTTLAFVAIPVAALALAFSRADARTGGDPSGTGYTYGVNGRTSVANTACPSGSLAGYGAGGVPVCTANGWIPSGLGPNGTCNWTTQTPTTLSTDTTYTLCGLTWTKINSSNDAAPASVGPSGLRFQPVSNTQFGMGARTAPMVSTPFVSFVPGFTPSTPIKICISATSNLAANYDYGFAGVDTGQYQPLQWRFGAAFNGIPTQQIAGFTNGGTGVSGYTQSLAGAGGGSNGTSDPTMCATFPTGVAAWTVLESSSPTVYDAGITWPDVTPRAFFNTGGGGNSGSWPTTSAGYALAIGAAEQQSSTGLIFTVAQIAVWFRP